MTDRRLGLALCASATAFTVLTVVVALNPRLAVDDALARTLLATPGSARWHVVGVVSTVASGPGVAVLGAVAAGWALYRRRPVAEAIAVLAAPLLAGLIEIALKSVVGRSRPITAALTGESGNGYPSGHVTGFTALIVTIALLHACRTSPGAARRAVAFAVVAIGAVAWARIAVGAHYPTDTAGGALLGATIALATIAWVQARSGAGEPDSHPSGRERLADHRRSA